MFGTKRVRRLSWGVALLMLGIVAAGCTQTGSSTDREQTYQSTAALAEDSDLVAVGVVDGNVEVADIEGSESMFTISDIEIVEIVAAAETGSWTEGQTIELRQFGVAGSREQIAPVELVEEGKTYLLFLTLSGLEGKQAEQFYITGASAGLYEPVDQSQARSASPASVEDFQQVEPDEFEPNLTEVAISELE